MLWEGVPAPPRLTRGSQGLTRASNGFTQRQGLLMVLAHLFLFLPVSVLFSVAAEPGEPIYVAVVFCSRRATAPRQFPAPGGGFIFPQ